MDEFRKIALFCGAILAGAWSDMLAFFGHSWRGLLKFFVPAALAFLVLWWKSTPSEQAEFSFYLKHTTISVLVSLGCALVIFIFKIPGAIYRLRPEESIDESFQILLGQGGSFVQPLQIGALIGALYRVRVVNTTADAIPGVI